MRDPVCPLRLAFYGHPETLRSSHDREGIHAYHLMAQLLLPPQAENLPDCIRRRLQVIRACRKHTQGMETHIESVQNSSQGNRHGPADARRQIPWTWALCDGKRISWQGDDPTALDPPPPKPPMGEQVEDASTGLHNPANAAAAAGSQFIVTGLIQCPMGRTFGHGTILMPSA